MQANAKPTAALGDGAPGSEDPDSGDPDSEDPEAEDSDASSADATPHPQPNTTAAPTPASTANSATLLVAVPPRTRTTIRSRFRLGKSCSQRLP